MLAKRWRKEGGGIAGGGVAAIRDVSAARLAAKHRRPAAKMSIGARLVCQLIAGASAPASAQSSCGWLRGGGGVA